MVNQHEKSPIWGICLGLFFQPPWPSKSRVAIYNNLGDLLTAYESLTNLWMILHFGWMGDT